MTRTILLASDRKQILELVNYTALMLTKLNHQVTILTSSDRDECLRLAEVDNTSMVMLDLNISTFKPVEFIKALRADPNSKNKKIIAFIDEDGADLKQEIYSAGCDSIMITSEFKKVLSHLLEF